MRADRLVATLLILQHRGTATVAEIAEELEVSPRTTRRDLEALAMSGVPVYSRPGRGGGWSLIGGARTDLTGLTASEAEALFLVAGPSSRATPELKAALRKLVGALPQPFRERAEAAAGAVIIDDRRWGQIGPDPEPPTTTAGRGPGPHPGSVANRQLVERALVERRRIRLGYRSRERAESTREADPWGLVAKRGTWYLLAGTAEGRRTFRLDRVTSVEVLDAPAELPEGLDIEREWAAVDEEIARRRSSVAVELLVDADALPLLRAVLSVRVEVVDRPTGSGRVLAAVNMPSARAAVGELAGFGTRLEVLTPAEVRDGLGAIGRELAGLYPAPTDRSGVGAPDPTPRGAGRPTPSA